MKKLESIKGKKFNSVSKQELNKITGGQEHSSSMNWETDRTYVTTNTDIIQRGDGLSKGEHIAYDLEVFE